ncbi:MAG: DNA polymerase III subunit delta [Mycetocola reblochoni]|uniref:DNA-directed DNA polymerase n=2 Tax=Mycetocola reblochoni TaxID=331618 RepID=A0A3L6ZQN6_9MICO|nr:DNA polymerase III subunit delta [Mycetocola reblochoni]RLP69901.1 DNA polymerase III subunit delta [Mycetocola reblochoni]
MAAAGRGAPRKTAGGRTLAWDQIRPAPVILVSGTQTFLADRAIGVLRDYLRAEDPSVEIHEVYADSVGPGELQTLASPSLFGEPRLVIVRGVEKMSDSFLADALAYLASPADGATVLLRHGGGVRGKKLLDAVRSAGDRGIEVACAELKKEQERHDFAAAEFARASRRIRPRALQSLVTAFSGDLAELAAACQQLIADTSGDITEAVVDQYYGGRAETTAFAVADAAVQGDYASALGGLRNALSSGVDPVPLVAAIAMKVRGLAKVSGSRGSSAELAKRLGMAPWQVERAQRDLRGWTDAGLGVAIQALADADAAVKGESRDPVFAVERLIGIIAAKGGVRGGRRAAGERPGR